MLNVEWKGGWAYPGFVDRLVFESGDSGLTLLKLNG
jgi:hypothetical protein